MHSEWAGLSLRIFDSKTLDLVFQKTAGISQFLAVTELCDILNNIQKGRLVVISSLVSFFHHIMQNVTLVIMTKQIFSKFIELFPCIYLSITLYRQWILLSFLFYLIFNELYAEKFRLALPLFAIYSEYIRTKTIANKFNPHYRSI